MVALANGARTRMLYVAESVHGATPATPTMLELRCLGRDINLKKAMLGSEEIRSDREIQDLRHGYRRVEGNLPFEFGHTYLDDMIEAALSGTWAASTAVDPVGVVSLKFNRATGSFITDGYRAGDYIVAAGFTAPADNGVFRIVSLTATDITVAETLTNEAAGAGKSVNTKGKRVSIGTTLRTFTFERQFLDVPLYDPFTGIALNSFSLDVKPEQLIKGSLGLVGMDAGAESGTSGATAVTSAATNAPFSSFQGAIYEGGSAIAVATGLMINLNNNRSGVPVIASAVTPDIFEGRAVVTGQLTAFFSSAALFNKFVNETESSLEVKFVDPADTTKFINVLLPRIKYTGGDRNPPKEGPVPLVMPFQALDDLTTGTTMSVQRSNT